MSVEMIARAWSRPVAYTSRSQRAPYSASWSSITAMLRGELSKLGARTVVVEMDVTPEDIRNDGWLRSTARPRTHGVRLSFTCKHGELCYEGAAWSNWEHNVYAMARTLRAQRMIGRDGCVRGDQVYRGWKQLPGGGAQPIQASEWASVDAAIRWLAELCELPSGYPVEKLYRACATFAHPDRGGSDELMAKVNRAKDFIEKHGTVPA